MELNRKRHWLDYIFVGISIIVFLLLIELVYPHYFFKNDNIDSYVCGYSYAFDALIHGKIAVYNFHQLLGTPFLAQGQNGALYFPAWISVFFSKVFFGGAHMSTEIAVFLHLVVAGVSMYRLCEKLFLGRLASYIAAISWALNSFTIYESRVWLIVAIATAWLPLMITCSLELINGSGLKTYLITALPRTILFYGGHPQFWAYAMIFELLFFTVVCLLVYKSRLREFGMIMMRMFISYVPTLLVMLPLLLPMWRVMNNSSERSSSLELETFLDHKYEIAEWLIGVLFPFTQIDNYEAKNTFEEIAINSSHYGYVLFFSSVFFILLIVKMIRNGEKSKINRVAVGAVIVLIFGILWQSSETFNRVIYFVPILNRFRWPYKLNVEVMFFAVLLGAFALSKLSENVKENRKRILAAVLIVILFADFAVLYMLVPFKYHGVRVEGDLTADEPYYELISQNRYATIGFPQWIFDENLIQGANKVEELNYNFATYFGFENFSGYDVLSPEDIFERNSEYEKIPLTGSIANPTDEFIEHMRQLGVSIYIVSGYAHFDQYVEESTDKEFDGTEMYAFLEEKGMELISDNGIFRIYKDPYALYPVYSLDGDGEIRVLDHSTDYNDLVIQTPADFEGGTINIGYRYDDYFEGSIDGIPEVVTKNSELETMAISVPSGQHTVRLEYKDDLLIVGTVICFSGLILFSLVIMFKSKMSKGDT